MTESKHCRMNPYSFIERKEHAIRLAKIIAGLKKHKIHRYTKEFHEYDARVLHDFINSRIISFNLLDVFEKRLIEIEKFIAENKAVKK